MDSIIERRIATVLYLIIVLLAGAIFYRFLVKGAEIINLKIDKALKEIVPAPKIVSVQTSLPVPVIPIAAKISKEVAQRRAVKMKVTAYCLCKICCGKWAFRQAQGKTWPTSIGDDARVYDGVAADPNLLPYRTCLKIPGIGIKEVDDTGGGMRQSAKQGIYHIDVRMSSHEAARKWGVRWLDVAVLGP